MEIILGKTAGFCGGVANAVNMAKKEIDKTKKEVYCLGDLVHNKQVIDKLISDGLKIVDTLENVNETIIIRAHGATKEMYYELNKKNIKIIDLTCVKVLKIHNIAEEYSNEGYYIILIGEKQHSEVIGTYSFCGNYKNIIEKIEDIEDVIRDIEIKGLKNVLVISQTTFNLNVFKIIIEKIKENLEPDINLEVINTICNATKIRQEETEKLSKNVELMIIIGGKKSSNTNKLYEISKQNCKNVIFIQSQEDIDKEYIEKFNKIGIMAGASTPKESINSVVDYLKQFTK